MKVTINNINKALPEGYEILKSNGCFYFVGDGEYGDTYMWFSPTVYVNKLTDLTVERWVEEFFSLAEDNN